MKHILILIAFTFFLAREGLALEQVEPKAFSGMWHEIARTPNAPQRNCVKSEVEYLWEEGQKYSVFNRCVDHEGALISYKGKAKGVEEGSMHIMDMTYFWVFTQRYYVYHVLEDYAYAVVGDEAFDKVWIMSRAPTMPPWVLEDILGKLEGRMRTERFIFADQNDKGKNP